MTSHLSGFHDDDDSRDLVVSILEKCEAITVPASSGEQALSIIEHEVPDVLVSDIGMPGMSGYEIAKHLRSVPSLQGVIIAAVTGYGQESERQRSFEAGFDYHLTKQIPSRACNLLPDYSTSPRR